MRRLAIVVNERCNIDCAYCFNTTHDTNVKRRGDVFGATAEGIEGVVAALSARDYDSVTLTGGEPTVSRRFPLWMGALAEAGIPTVLITNLVHMPPEIEALIVGHPAMVVHVSVGGGSEAVHNAERAKFAETRANLEKLRALGVACAMTMVITPSNIAHLPEFEAFCAETGCQANAVPVSGVLGELLSALPEHVWFETIAGMQDERLMQQLFLGHAFTTGGASPTSCAMRTQTHVMGQNGDLIGCFFREDLAFGNLLTEDPGAVLDRAWSDTRLRADCFGKHCIGIHIH